MTRVLRFNSADPISSFLAFALVLLGIGTAVLLAIPELVTVGFILMILPGLVMSLIPTAFLYVLVFSVAWFALRQQASAWLAAAMGLCAAYGVGMGLPGLLNRQTAVWAAEAASRNVEPAARLGNFGSIGTQRDGYTSNQSRCEDLCQILLYNGTAARVVSLSTKTVTARQSYSIDRQKNCPDPGKAITANGNQAWFFNTSLPVQVEAAVRVRIASGECLSAEGGNAGKPDLMIRFLEETLGPRRSRLSLAPGGVVVKALQLEQQGRVVARGAVINPHYLKVPLILETYGYAFSTAGWQWARRENTQDLEMLKLLKRFTAWNLDPPQGADPDTLRDRIDDVMNDQTLSASDASFRLIHDYFGGLPQDSGRDDARRVARIIADDRVVKLSPVPIYRFPRDTDRVLLLDPILDRLTRLARARQWDDYRILDQALEKMPVGTFRKADARVESLLTDAESRDHSPGLVRRLADGGRDAGPRLFDIYRQTWTQPQTKSARQLSLSSRNAALYGICELGSAAQALLPRLREFTHSGVARPSDFDSRLFRATLIALGASAEEFTLPKNFVGQDEPYRRQLERAAEEKCRNL